LPEPVVLAQGGREPYSVNHEVATSVYWMITVAADS
jgi:hypothetical protein